MFWLLPTRDRLGKRIECINLIGGIFFQEKSSILDSCTLITGGSGGTVVQVEEDGAHSCIKLLPSLDSTNW